MTESSSSKTLTALAGITATSSGSKGRKHRRGSRDSLLPTAYKSHLNSLFTEIETEFEKLYVENLRLKEQVLVLEKAVCPDTFKLHMDTKEQDDADGFDMNVLKSFTKKNFPKTRTRLKAQTSRIVSSFKTSAVSASFVREFSGHRDGLWDVCVREGGELLGTASADRTARVWAADSGRCLLRYSGHQGSVNSIAFHPGGEGCLVVTGSGDSTCHVWQAGGHRAAVTHSSGEEEGGQDSDTEQLLTSQHSEGQTAASLLVLAGHSSVVVSAAWLLSAGGNSHQVVTASWDRTAALWDINTGVLLQSMSGHDRELTGATCHHSSRLVVTSSRDSTFRLWDFRDNIHSVSVFQGHTDSVTSAAFSSGEHIVSGSDDRSVKVWDLRNMRAPLTNIQTDSQVNKLAVSAGGMLAVPQDNRHVYLYDISGAKLARLPRESRKCHHRMVSSVAWGTQGDRDTALYSVGFDRLAMAWKVRGKEENSLKGTKEGSREGY